MQKINIAEKFAKVDKVYDPRIAGELNGQYVKLVRALGEYVWHEHANEDEMFLIVKGKLRIEFRDGPVDLDEGEFIIIPKGVEHKPVANSECEILLFEPKATVNTGAVTHEYTKQAEELAWV